MLRATFFDLDGTLVDTEPLHCAAVRETLATVGLSIDELDYYRRYLSLTDRATFERAAEDFERPDLRSRIEELVADKEKRFAERLAGGARLFEGAAEFVAAAATRCTLALVTGARRHEALALLERDGLRGRFAVVVTADDVKRGKPDPEPYHVAFERIRDRFVPNLMPTECLAIEDAPLGIVSASAAGMRTLAVTTSRPVEDLAGADLVTTSFAAADWPAIEALFSPGSRPQ